MSEPLKAVNAYRPRVVRGPRVTLADLVAFISRSTGLTESTVGMVLTELRDAVIFFNRRGQAVRLDGLGTYSPGIKLDGRMTISHYADPQLRNALNSPGAFRGTIQNRESIGLTLEDLISRWNEEHPDDPIQ